MKFVFTLDIDHNSFFKKKTPFLWDITLLLDLVSLFIYIFDFSKKTPFFMRYYSVFRKRKLTQKKWDKMKEIDTKCMKSFFPLLFFFGVEVFNWFASFKSEILLFFWKLMSIAESPPFDHATCMHTTSTPQSPQFSTEIYQRCQCP